MKTTKPTTDLLGRTHQVSYNFTVRTNGYKSWVVYLDLICETEKLTTSYTANNIEDYIDAPDKAGNLFSNIPAKVNIEIQDWLSDVFPRYQIIDAETGSVLMQERTKSDAIDTQESFYFVTTNIIDTWNLKR